MNRREVMVKRLLTLSKDQQVKVFRGESHYAIFSKAKHKLKREQGDGYDKVKDTDSWDYAPHSFFSDKRTTNDGDSLHLTQYNINTQHGTMTIDFHQNSHTQ